MADMLLTRPQSSFSRNFKRLGMNKFVRSRQVQSQFSRDVEALKMPNQIEEIASLVQYSLQMELGIEPTRNFERMQDRPVSSMNASQSSGVENRIIPSRVSHRKNLTLQNST